LLAHGKILPDFSHGRGEIFFALFSLKQYSQAVTSFEEALRYKSDYQEASKGKEQAIQAAQVISEEESREQGSSGDGEDGEMGSRGAEEAGEVSQ